MIEALTIIVSALAGGTAVYIAVRPKLAELTRLTDRDELGRYKKDDPQ